MEDRPVPMTALQLATTLQRTAHVTGECICGGKMIFDRIEVDDSGAETKVYRLPHRRDCPVFLVFGQGARSPLQQ